MNHSDFVHLHVHTQFSLLDGACRIKDLCSKAAEYGMPALAMTDHGNMFGTVDFYQTAVKAGIKPIIGCECYVATLGDRFEKNSSQKGTTAHLTLLAKNEQGYRNLLKLTSAGFLEGFYYHPRIDRELIKKHSEGLVCLSGCLKGELSSHLMRGDYQSALKLADDYRHIFGQGNYYLEIMDHGLPQQKQITPDILKISKELGLPVVVTNDVHYMEQKSARAHEALLCIQTQSFLDDQNRMRMSSDQFYFKSSDQMYKEFHWIEQGLKNTVEIAEKVNFEMNFDKFYLPHFDPPNGLSQKEYLKKLCLQAVPQRYGEMTTEISHRLTHELEVIDRMGFDAYFLIVWDFINFAKSVQIPVGPGRGSAAGSIVSFLLGITDLDPIKYGLLFERFLNPDRAGMPDIDIDFCFERRGEVIEYVNRKYSQENVAQIITFGTMQAKAAIRDVGRVMGVAYGDVDRIAKLVPNDLGIKIEDALEKEPQLLQLYEDDKSTRDIIDMAKVLEGLNRHASIHAAGVVIADKDLSEYVPLYKSSDGQITTGYTMNGIAKIGLLKMDFLGLRTLTVISDAVKLIKKVHQIDIDISTISLEDQKTYDLLSRASTFGVFQLESSGMRDLLKKIKPSEFEDIISILALYRPGPMGSGMLDDFIKRKRGSVLVHYDHPKLEPVLKATYGIIVYQEQVMQIPVVLAGFSLVQADHLRRAMSKKIASVMEQMRIDFVNGCLKHSGISNERANNLFDLIDYFSGYGFNRSHSAAYALISYQTAYLKANYPVEFMCSLLTSEKDNTDKVVEYVKECEALGLKVVPPNVNESVKNFDVKDQKTITYGLIAVKNVGSTAIDSILEGRKSGGSYQNIFDFCERVDLRLVNRKVLESLIKCGAFNDFGIFRSQMMAVVDRALERGAKKQREKFSGQVSFFDLGDEGFAKEEEKYPNIREWHQTQILAYEKEILGFYISGHPLNHYQIEIKEFTDTSTKELSDCLDGQEIRIVGMIIFVKLTNTRKTNERMAILKIEDMYGETEVVVFPSAYEKLAPFIKDGEVIFLKAKTSTRDGEVKLIANDMMHMKDVYRSIKSIRVDLSNVGEKGLVNLKAKLKSSPGRIPVYLKVDTKSHKGVQILVGEDLFVSPNENLMNEIKELVGSDKFSLTL